MLFLAEYADKTMLEIQSLLYGLQFRYRGKLRGLYNGICNGTYNITQKVEESDK